MARALIAICRRRERSNDRCLLSPPSPPAAGREGEKAARGIEGAWRARKFLPSSAHFGNGSAFSSIGMEARGIRTPSDKFMPGFDRERNAFLRGSCRTGSVWDRVEPIPTEFDGRDDFHVVPYFLGGIYLFAMRRGSRTRFSVSMSHGPSLGPGGTGPYRNWVGWLVVFRRGGEGEAEAEGVVEATGGAA